ncbi:MAG: class I SAM-dependent methyltransferase [Henriciella sp.]|jgi:SAM-dependent MidA family methyltransferase
MSALKDLLTRLIQADGPMPVSTFMTLCLHHRDFGYYATRPGVGRDFITAPESSQVFGDMIGLWLAQCWSDLGRPSSLQLAELGPGRATLMADALRATRPLDGFHAALSLSLVEASPPLRSLQAEKLEAYGPGWIEDISELAPGPALILANEYLDCLPPRQFVHTGDAWCERMIGLTPSGTLAFGLSKGVPPIGEQPLPDGKTTKLEIQPGLETLTEHLRLRADAGHPFAALFIDYGPATTPPGDTLRAYYQGRQIDPLARPGDSDLTVDVDFARLAHLGRQAGLSVHGPVQQGPFLLSLGAEAHLNRLARTAPDGGEALYRATRRLIDPEEMGARFKVICLSHGLNFTPVGF